MECKIDGVSSEESRGEGKGWKFYRRKGSEGTDQGSRMCIREGI